MNAQRSISIIGGIIVLFLAVSAAVLSYDALYRLALANGITSWLAWLWPLCLDAFMVSASLAVLRNSLVSEGTWYQWALVILFTILSIIFNAIHAPATWLARGIFALPPLVVFLAFELLVSQIRSAVRRHAVSQTLDAMNEAVSRAKAELADLEKQADALSLTLDTTPASDTTPAHDTAEHDTVSVQRHDTAKMTPTSDTKSQRHALILSIIAGDSSIRYPDLAARLSVSLPTVKRDMAELIDTGKVKRNGHGLEVVTIAGDRDTLPRMASVSVSEPHIASAN